MLDATPLLRLYARWRQPRLDAQDAVAAQGRELLKLVATARDTRFGRAHGFAEIKSVADFQARVPLRGYDEFWTEYWKPAFPRLVDCTWPGTMPYFALSSGTTTGVTKYIPCSREMTAANVRAGLDVMVHHVANRPRTRMLGGRNLMLGGSTDLRELAPGVVAGDLSGIAGKIAPWWARLRYFPPRAIETIPDWETKIARMAEAALAEDIRSISGAPSWMLIFFDKLAELHPERDRRIAAFFPNLEMIVHGAVSFTPYRKLFTELLEGSHAETREVYAASEGFIAAADRGDGEGMRLVADNGLFFEFVPVAELGSARPTRHWLKDVEPEVNYAVALTSCAGLWAYLVGDTLRFVERRPPRLLITGRTSYMLSAFGEHLIDEEIEDSVAAAAAAIEADVVDYTVGALMPDKPGELGQHLYVVEFAKAAPANERLGAFARTLDEALAATNEDYESHRAGLNPPRIHAVPPGTFAAWMKSRGKLGGQNKVPRIINDESLFQALRDFAGCG